MASEAYAPSEYGFRTYLTTAEITYFSHSDGWTSFLKVYYIFYYLPSVWRTQVRHKKGMQRERLPLGERNDAFDMRYECQKCLCVTFAKVTKA